MKLIKNIIHTFNPDDDIYIIASTKNYLVTNDNYHGIYLFNKNDNFSNQKINIKKQLSINCIFTHFDKDIAALYCPEDNHIIIINLTTYDTIFIIIPATLQLYENEFLPVYYWKEQTFIIITYDKRIFSIDIETKQIIAISSEILKQQDFYLYLCFNLIPATLFINDIS